MKITKRKIAAEAMFIISMIAGFLLVVGSLLVGMIVYFPAGLNVAIIILAVFAILVKSLYEHLLDDYKTKGYAIV